MVGINHQIEILGKFQRTMFNPVTVKIDYCFVPFVIDLEYLMFGLLQRDVEFFGDAMCTTPTRSSLKSSSNSR